MARRRTHRKRSHRRRRIVASNPRRRRSAKRRRNPFAVRHVGRRVRRRYRRNPFGGSSRGLLGTAIEGAKDGAGIVVGKAVSRTVARYLPASISTGMIGLAAQAVVATGVGIAGHKVLGPRWGKLMAGGAWAALYENILATVNFPVLSAAVHGYVTMMGYVPLQGGMPAQEAYRSTSALAPAVGGYDAGTGAEF